MSFGAIVVCAALTGLAHDRPRLQLQHHGDGGDVGGVEDLRAVRQVDGPQLGRHVEHVDPAPFAACDLRPVAPANQVRGVADDPVARLRLGALLHLHRHHGLGAQVDHGHVAFLDET
ncbi:hypothetical protein EYF80_022750 [Liparis tanakae]|uniref:Uncharacterized protein n=1 Tax=Liparis tanakae TaxID=230148 RepID=A0A4Z2HMK0_9TELE|nr:hypothetical protein EYF80_022750 [Liparis tanakae]